MNDADLARHLAEVENCLMEAEASSHALAETVRILTRTGYDTSEALLALWTEMDGIEALREICRCLRTAAQERP